MAEGGEYREEVRRRLGSVRVSRLSELWIEYDRQTDTLYINFGKGEPDETIMIDNDVIIGLEGDELVSIIIQDFSRRAGLRQW